MKPWETPLNKAPSKGGEKEQRERERGPKYEHPKGLMTWHHQMSISIYLFITLDSQKCDGTDSFEVVGGWVGACLVTSRTFEKNSFENLVNTHDTIFPLMQQNALEMC